jgi:predicted small lipoprotein YifL
MKSTVLLCAAVIPLTMTAACGQKGPLYLPPRNGTVVTRPATSNTTPNTPPTTDQPSSTPPQTTPPQTSSPQATGPGPASKQNNNDSSQPPR